MDIYALEDNMVNLIINSNEYRELKELEDRLALDKEVVSLSSKMNELGKEYLLNKDKDVDIKPYQERYLKATLELNNHLLVKEYNDKLNKVNEIIEYLNKSLFLKFIDGDNI